MPEPITIVTVGGTIDKVYFDALSDFAVGESAMTRILSDANVTIEVRIAPLMRKDSLDMDDADRTAVRDAVAAAPGRMVIVTHGTDTMAKTAALARVPGKTVVFTGAMQPASQRDSDAVFNTGFALAAVQLLPEGAWIAINGRVFDAAHVAKDRANNRFVET